MLFQNMKGEIPGKESYTIWPVCDDNKLTSMKVKNKTKKKTSIVNA